MSMTLKGKYNEATVFTDNIDSETISQVIELLNQPFVADSKVRIMPDCHAGKGCVVGTTMTLTDKVVPNLVGVDIGCLDKDTEILTPNGWIKISEYNNEDILVYNMNNDTAYFDKPNMFIKNPCKEFYHFINTKNLDQMVSDEHHMLVFQGTKKRGHHLNHYNAKDFAEKIKRLAKADNYCAKTTFKVDNSSLDFTDNDIRIFVMISADGRLKQLVNGETYIELHFKKERKIKRAIELLSSADIQFSHNVWGDGSTCISFSSNKFNTKDLTQFFKANTHQLKILSEESLLWDGTIDSLRNHKHFVSNNKKNADVIQFAYSATGVRASMSKVTHSNNSNWNDTYVVTPTKNEYVSYRTDMIKKVPAIDGYKYCFNTNTGAFVARRNDCIFVTGNCGMYALKLEEKGIDMKLLDEVINTEVPSGFSVHDRAIVKFDKLKDIRCDINIDNANRSIGSLGGGNHFIEIDKDKDGALWLVIHCGSRHLGIEVCDYYQKAGYKTIKHNDIDTKIKETIADLKAKGLQKDIENTVKILKMQAPNIPEHLAYVEGQLFENYIHDMRITQEYAKLNRRTIADIIVHDMDLHPVDSFDTIHNYIDCDNMILRKGSISAQKGEQVIIPMNMRDGSLICIGKGNPDWNFSAPHGAGRIMSRSQAKANVDFDAFKKSMKGIYSTSVVQSTVDESPMVYKPIDEIMGNIIDTVDIIDVIKPVYNFKAH